MRRIVAHGVLLLMFTVLADAVIHAAFAQTPFSAPRAVQPAQVEAKEYARFLPATVSAATLYGVSLSANFARVNAFATELRTLDG